MRYDWSIENVFNGVGKRGINYKVGADFCRPDLYYVESEISGMRRNLTYFGVERFKKFCIDYAKLVSDYCFNLKRG